MRYLALGTVGVSDDGELIGAVGLHILREGIFRHSIARDTARLAGAWSGDRCCIVDALYRFATAPRRIAAACALSRPGLVQPAG